MKKVILVVLLAFGAWALAQDFKLSAGGFVTASDVRDHNKLGQDIADIRGLLAQTPPNFQQAFLIYGYGKNFPWKGITHSLGRFSDDYENNFAKFFPASLELYGRTTYLHEFFVSAFMGTGRFSSSNPAQRIAAIDGAMLSVVLQWCRFEIKIAEGKAKASTPNFSASNGALKNWNEYFAFYWGPNGQHSLAQEVASLVQRFRATDANELVYAVLADGQIELLKPVWAENQARQLETITDGISLLLFLGALDELSRSSGDATSVAWFKTQGRYFAAAEALARADMGVAKTILKQLLTAPDASTIAAIRTGVVASLGKLFLTRADFGTALP